MPAAGAEPRFRYLLHDPDGEMPYWTWINHDDSGWRTAADAAALAAAIRASGASQVFVRFTLDHTPESVNNSWLHIRHSGPIEIFVNGQPRGGSRAAAPSGGDYHVSPRRIEHSGLNVYGIHFKHGGGGEPLLDIGWRSSPWKCADDGAFRPPPVMPDEIRDAQVCRGGDGAWYLTGTTGDEEFIRPGPKCWLVNPGIRVFRSTDLTNWKSLGHVWTFERDGTWNREFGTFGGRGPARAVFAPEIHYLKGRYWLVYSVNSTTPARQFGIGLACADSPEGPWREMSPDKPVTEGFDPTLFEDDDGTVYLLKHGGEIARMKADMSGVDEAFRHLAAADFPRVGYEGVSMFKRGGRYYLTSAEWNLHADGRQSYDCMIAAAASPAGPFGDRRCLIRFGGHNGFFNGPEGALHATVWCYPDNDPHWQRVSILRLEDAPETMFRIAGQ